MFAVAPSLIVYERSGILVSLGKTKTQQQKKVQENQRGNKQGKK